MRLPEGPWYRASRDAWFVEIDGRQVKLAKGKANKKAALEAFHRIVALGPAGLPRVVYLTPGMVELCRLCERWPEGPIFRGHKRKGSRPFSRNGLRCRFRLLRAKLPPLKGVVSYTARHTFITDALERGVPVATVAELAGHKDLKMIQQHYSHLSEKRKHLQEAVRRATGYAGGAEAPPAA